MARFRVGLTSWSLLMLIATACAQSLPLSASGVDEKLLRPAGIVFSGTVVRIEHEPVEDGKPAAIRIALRVDEALRGCNAGETIEIAEWAELWARGDRYRVGQKVFLILYPRNEAGLTSPVADNSRTLVQHAPSTRPSRPQRNSPTSSQPGERPTSGESPYPTEAPAGLRSSFIPKPLVEHDSEVK